MESKKRKEEERTKLKQDRFETCFKDRAMWREEGTDIKKKSSLHNIILNVFRVILVLWRLLFLVEAFSFLHHSCSKKFLWRWKVHIVWVGLYTKSVSYLSQNTNNNNDISSPLELFLNNYDIRKRKHCLGERESPTSNNRLHNTKTTRKTFNIIL